MRFTCLGASPAPSIRNVGPSSEPAGPGLEMSNSFPSEISNSSVHLTLAEIFVGKYLEGYLVGGNPSTNAIKLYETVTHPHCYRCVLLQEQLLSMYEQNEEQAEKVT